MGFAVDGGLGAGAAMALPIEWCGGPRPALSVAEEWIMPITDRQVDPHVSDSTASFKQQQYYYSRSSQIPNPFNSLIGMNG